MCWARSYQNKLHTVDRLYKIWEEKPGAWRAQTHQKVFVFFWILYPEESTHRQYARIPLLTSMVVSASYRHSLNICLVNICLVTRDCGHACACMCVHMWVCLRNREGEERDLLPQIVEFDSSENNLGKLFRMGLICLNGSFINPWGKSFYSCGIHPHNEMSPLQFHQYKRILVCC